MFEVKDSGARQEFESGMVRDTTEGKTDYTRILDGPMFDRWADHLSKGAVKYPDVAPGVANWTLANGEEELARFKKSAMRHFRQWLRGDVDEDHAAAVYFNVNGAEYVKERITVVEQPLHRYTVRYEAVPSIDRNYPELRALDEKWPPLNMDEFGEYTRDGVRCCNEVAPHGFFCTLPVDHTGKHCATDAYRDNDEANMREWD
jgi:hypothetical protein